MPLILIVEDNIDLRTIFLSVFGRESFTAIAVDGGQAAIDYLKTATPLPDIIVLDLNMPEVTGVDVFQYLKSDERTKHIKVMVVTGNPQFRDQPELEGVDIFLDKPIDIHVLRHIAERLSTQILDNTA